MRTVAEEYDRVVGLDTHTMTLLIGATRAVVEQPGPPKRLQPHPARHPGGPSQRRRLQGARRRAGLPTVPHAADHADLPHPVLDLGRSVGNEAVLAVERLCARFPVGHPQRHRLLRSRTASSSAGPAPAPWWAAYT